MKNADKSAFPLPLNGIKDEDGLTKREYFAAMAMQGVASTDGRNGSWLGSPKKLAIMAVQAADALLEELEKTETENQDGN